MPWKITFPLSSRTNTCVSVTALVGILTSSYESSVDRYVFFTKSYSRVRTTEIRKAKFIDLWLQRPDVLDVDDVLLFRRRHRAERDIVDDDITTKR